MEYVYKINIFSLSLFQKIFLTASSAAVLYVAFFSSCCSSCWLFLPSLFVQFWPVQSPIIGKLVFWSVSFLFQTILSNARLDRSKLDKKGHKVVKSPTAIAGRDQLNLEFLLLISQVPFCPVLTCPIYHWTAGIFVCFRFTPNNSVQC